MRNVLKGIFQSRVWFACASKNARLSPNQIGEDYAKTAANAPMMSAYGPKPTFRVVVAGPLSGVMRTSRFGLAMSANAQSELRSALLVAARCPVGATGTNATQ